MLLLVLVIVVVLARRSGRSRRTTIDLGELPLTPTDPLALEGVDVDELPALPEAPRQLAPDPVALKRAEIGQLVDDQPEEVADLLRGWLAGASAGGKR